MDVRSWLVAMLVAMTCGLWADGEFVALSEDAAVRTALQNHPTLKAARAGAGAARSRTEVARSEGELQVSANALATVSSRANLMGTAGVWPAAPLRSQDEAAVDLNAMARYPLSTGGRISQTIRAAEFDEAAYASEVGATEVWIAWRARVTLANWREALALVKVADATVEAQLKSTMVVEYKEDAGKVPKFDLLRSQAELAAAQQELAQADADVLTARAHVAEALGVPEDVLWQPAGEPPREPVGDALGTALQQRPELVAGRYRISAAQARLTASKASYKPQIYAVGRADALAPSEMGDNVGLTVGVIAGIPLVDGGRRRAELDEARHTVTRAKASLAALELAVRAQVASAQAQAGAARQNIDSAEAQVTASEEGYFVAQVRYNAGKSIVVELLDSLRGLTQAQENLVAARAKYSRAIAGLWRAIGVSVLPVGE